MPSTLWPSKRDLFGVQVSATEYDHAVESIMAAAQRRQGGVASFFAVHAVVTAANDPRLLEKVNRFNVVAPDGQPVRWALNWLYGAKLKENVRGSEAMWRACQRAEADGVSIYLYGGTDDVLESLAANLKQAFPNLNITGQESPPFRPLTPEEDDAVVQRINDSGAGIVFIGLGCPKQDFFAADHVDRIHAIQLCVGAAFDFHAGKKPTAPRWMQKSGLEWFFRLCQEPRRLWKRYLVTNTQFCQKLARQWLASRIPRGPGKRAPAGG